MACSPKRTPSYQGKAPAKTGAPFWNVSFRPLSAYSINRERAKRPRPPPRRRRDRRSGQPGCRKCSSPSRPVRLHNGHREFRKCSFPARSSRFHNGHRGCRKCSSPPRPVRHHNGQPESRNHPAMVTSSADGSAGCVAPRPNLSVFITHIGSSGCIISAPQFIRHLQSPFFGLTEYIKIFSG